MDILRSPLRLVVALSAFAIGMGLASDAAAQTPVPADTILDLQNPRTQIQQIPDLSSILPQEVADRHTLESVQPGVYLTQPEVIEHLATDTSGQTPSRDSLHVYTSQLSGGLQRTPISAASAPEGAASGRSRFLLPQQALARRGGRVEGYYRPFIETLGNELALNSTNEGFEGRLLVGVQDTSDSASSESLPTPVQFQFGVNHGKVNPKTVQIDHTHLPLQEIEISSDRVRDSVRLTILTSLSHEDIPISLVVRRPKLRVDATPEKSVSGLGLGTADLDVRLDRLSGEPVSVQLSAQRGAPEPGTVTVTGTTPANAEIRSSGLGTDTVTARAAGFRADTAVIRYVFPWVFLIGTLIGGLAGAGLRYLRGQSDERQHPQLGVQLGGGLLMALIVGVGSTVGVNLLGVEIGAQYGGALFFFIAAVGAYLWEHLRLAWLGG